MSLLAVRLTACPLLAEGAGAPAAGGGMGLLQMAPLALMLVLMYVLFFLPQQNKQRRYREMIAGIKQNDHVVTTGGLHGVVTGVQRDAGSLTLRLDESTGAKVRVSLWAIDSVLGADDGSAGDAGATNKK